MRMEDEIVYPFFRKETDDPENAFGELMDEHDDLARLLTDLATVIKNRNYDHFEESLTPLYKAMVEHNAHEEQVLSRKGSDSLLTRRDEILQRMEAMQPCASRAWEF